jgi:hypothetical protein
MMLTDGGCSLRNLRMGKRPPCSAWSMKKAQKTLRKRAPCPFHGRWLLKRSFLSMAVTIILLGFCVLGVTAVDNVGSVSAAVTVVPPPTNPQTSNATLGYDLTNGLREDSSTCTYEWGPMLVVYQKGDTSILNYSATSPIDTYVFSSDSYHGAISCAIGPVVRADENVAVYTGEHYLFIVAAPGSFYVLFVNRDPMMTPHVTLEIAVSLHPATTATTANLSSLVIPVSVSVILLVVLLVIFVTVRRRRMGADRAGPTV